VAEEAPQEEEVSPEEGKDAPSEEETTSPSKSSDEEVKDEGLTEPEKSA
jgi:hypothetical protein